MVKYLMVNDINAYKISFELSDYVWNIVIKWDHLAKSTVGMQWVRAIDSISANMAEGFGRFHKKDKIRFYYNSRGSLLESIDWTEKSNRRKLISEVQYRHIIDRLNALPREINYLIKITEEKLTI